MDVHRGHALEAQANWHLQQITQHYTDVSTSDTSDHTGQQHSCFATQVTSDSTSERQGLPTEALQCCPWTSIGDVLPGRGIAATKKWSLALSGTATVFLTGHECHPRSSSGCCPGEQK